MRTLADRLARGDDSAFAELYDLCADRLFRYAAARLRSPEGAADVVQTAFMRAVKSRKKFRMVENPVAYLVQIARNETIRAATGVARRQERTATPAEEIGNGKSTDGSDLREDAEALTQALERLDEADREIVELKSYSGLTFAEIAVVVGRPPATVVTRYRRALESLRGWLASEFTRR